MLVKLVECSDYKVVYGLLDIGNHKAEERYKTLFIKQRLKQIRLVY